MQIEELERVSGFWLNKDRTGSKADADYIYSRIGSFARSCKNGVLGTGHGNAVRCTPVDYTFHDGAFWIFSEGGQKFTHLFYNPNVSFAIYDTSGTFTNLHSLQVFGTAELIEPFCDEYVQNLEIRNIPVQGIKKLPYPMNLIKISPYEMILLDSSMKKDGYDNRQIWKKDQQQDDQIPQT